MSNYHRSVLLKEALDALDIKPGKIYFDATLGGGGHTKAIIEIGGRVVATDVDEDAISEVIRELGAKKTAPGVWETPNGSLKIYHRNFRELDQIAQESKTSKFAGILFDLGVSSYMFDTAEKGFSFSKDGPLDMRMDPSLEVTAADLLNALNEGELNELFTKLGQEPRARRLARDIVQARVIKRIESTRELAEIITKSIGSSGIERINPSTRVFMALRIAVNDELNNLREALGQASTLLEKGGRLVVISFHSLEDRIVKDFLKADGSLKILTKKPFLAGEEELKANPRSRSAKMRVAEKI